MHLTVFGATGRTGRHLVNQALEQGHHVTAFVRSPARLREANIPSEHERLRIIQGDVMDAVAVREAVAGADALLLALGHAPGSSHFVLEVGTRNVLRAMAQHDVKRLVNETGAGVQDPQDGDRGLGARLMSTALRLLAPDLLADAERQAALLRASDADWTNVRAPRLTDGPRTGNYRAGYLDLGLGAQIARADVADFMLKLAVDGGYTRTAPKVTAA